MKKEISCHYCYTTFTLDSPTSVKTPHYCPFCRAALEPKDATTIALGNEESKESLTTTSSAVSFFSELVPSQQQIKFSIGPYQVMESIGKGGMGEVFLAYDTICGRRLALKQIRPDLLDHKPLYNRFLKEAYITSQLAHPAIIPIYAIHGESKQSYYTMPFVEGETLKQLIRRIRQQIKKGDTADLTFGSIPSLMRIFLSICQAVAYAHSKKVLHRDLKPENIIVGQYGQIIILDWGLAKILDPDQSETEENISDFDREPEHNPLQNLTHIGKVVGTVAYMAPERALGGPSNIKTDVYSLGVILYQLLTLHPPFQRPSLKEFREKLHEEKLVDPIEIAPYRDIPHSLSRIVMKCLVANPDQRYDSVDAIIHDLENYIEGRSEWFQITDLNPSRKEDWEFQENVLIADHIALTRQTEIADWVSLMISKASFQENLKLEASVTIGEHGHGIGFLLCIPEAAERSHLNDGYCLWLGVEGSKSTKLLRSTMEVIHAPDVALKKLETYQIRIEKIDNNIHFYLNNTLQFSYISHLPLTGTHVGLLARDADFTIKDFHVYVGSQNVTVNCLAVPNAFLAHRYYTLALNEYRRIGYSFPGRAEGREAMFRAGITLLEQANSTEEREKKKELFDLAQEEFHHLHNTPGAPLEYLGKALIYRAQGEYEEEAKCFELAYRRYPRHPLLPILQEQIVYRLHESSRYHRRATFNFLLLTLRYLPQVFHSSNTQKLLNSLEKHWEPLFFIESHLDITDEQKSDEFVIKLAFWLARPYILEEMIDRLLEFPNPPSMLLSDALFCLIELGSSSLAQKKLQEIVFPLPHQQWLQTACDSYNNSLDVAVNELTKLPHQPSPLKAYERTLLLLMQRSLDMHKTALVYRLRKYATEGSLSPEASIYVNAYTAWAFLLDNQWEQASEILHHYSLEELNQDTTLLHFLYGCWLYHTEGQEIAYIHLSGVLEAPYPRSWTLLSHYIKEAIFGDQGWISKSFLWERRQLYRQLSLFYHCLGNREKAAYYQQLALQEAVDVTE